MHETITKKDLNKLKRFYGGKKGYIKVILERTGLSRTTLWNTLNEKFTNDDALDVMIDFMNEKQAEMAKKRKERTQKLSQI